MAVVLCLSSTSERAFSQTASRRMLRRHVPATATSAPIGRFALTNRLHLAIGLPLRNQAALGEFLRQLYDPASTNFHQFLTPQQFAGRFGPTEEDYRAVTRFAEANGFKVTGTVRSHLVLDAEASVSDVERAFQITLRIYPHPTEARNFVAPDREPSVPFDLPVAGIEGLSDFSRPHPLFRLKPASLRPLNGSATNGLYGGKDFRNAYASGATLAGSGQTVGLLEFDGYNGSDITNYENDLGLTNRVPLTNVLLDNFHGRAGGNNIEVALDIEMAMSMAPNLSRIIIYEGNPSSFSFNPADVVSRMADDNLAKQMSSSWTWSGGPEATIDASFMQMAAQGQSYFQASGDEDAYTGSDLLDASSQVNSPVGSTNITAVGGTTLTTDTNGTWSSETVWNWNSLPQFANVGSGGGVSTYYGIPWWQTNVSMAYNSGSTTNRNVPDVALTADNIFVVYTMNGVSTWTNVGGTSCAAPLWAGFTALVNQQRGLSGGGTLGFANPAIYAIGTGPDYTNCFHDITISNNIGTGTPGLYFATNGYDLCTGWGTPNGTNLINALAPRPYIIQPPLGLTVTNGNQVTLSVVPGGEPPFAYAWRLNGTNLAAGLGISGIASNILTFTSITTNDAGNYTVVVTNSSGSITSSVASVTVTVLQTNLPPILAPIANQIIHVGMTLVITNSATDPNEPPNALQFSLDPGAPPTAGIDPLTGILTWTPDSSYANTTNQITVRVTNDGVPPASTAQSFTVAVIPLAFQPVTLSNNTLTISWGAISGLTYRVEYTTNLGDPDWNDLSPDITAANSTASTTDFTEPDVQRFYRILILP